MVDHTYPCIHSLILVDGPSRICLFANVTTFIAFTHVQCNLWSFHAVNIILMIIIFRVMILHHLKDFALNLPVIAKDNSAVILVNFIFYCRKIFK